MTDEELEELKTKADSGDPLACLEYATIIYYRNFDSDNKNVKDYKIAWYYWVDAWRNRFSLDENGEIVLWKKGYVFYDTAKKNKIQVECKDKGLHLLLWGYVLYNDKAFKEYLGPHNYGTHSEIHQLLSIYLKDKNNDYLDNSNEICEFLLSKSGLENAEKEICYYLLARNHRDNPALYFKYLSSAEKWGPNAEYDDFYYYEVWYELGICYYEGNGTAQDYDKAVQYFEKTDHRGDAYLGEMYYKGIKFDKNIIAAFAYSYQINTSYKADILLKNELPRMWDISWAWSLYENLDDSDSKTHFTEIETLKNQEVSDCSVLEGKDNPMLDLALRNEIDNIISKIESILYRSIDDEIKKKLHEIYISYSYEEKKNTKFFDPLEMCAEIQKLIKEISEFSKDKKNEDWISEEELNSLIELLTNLNDLLMEDGSEEELEAALTELTHLGIIDCIPFFKKIRNLQDMLEVRSSDVLGEYCDDEFKITLYLKNIYNGAKNNEIEIELYTLNTFAHELFHAYHALSIKANQKQWHSSFRYESIVYESLARYFEYFYSRDVAKGITYIENFAKDRKDSYKALQTKIRDTFYKDMYCNPYSAAWYYTEDEYEDKETYKYGMRKIEHNLINHGKTNFGEKIFRKVFNESLDSVENAYNVLKIIYELDEMQ